MMAEEVAFYSGGHRLSGLFFHSLDQRAPALILCQGTIGVKEHYRFPELGAWFAENGFSALIFDYRGLGESEGPRDRIRPLEQVEDVRSAVTYLREQGRVDPNRVAVIGYCWGGPHAVYAAAHDERIRAVAEVVGMSDGRRWLRSLRAHHEWQAFLDRLAEDRRQRVLGKESEVVRMGEVLVGSPMAREGRRRIKEEIVPPGLTYQNPDLTLECAESILEYSPETVASRISPRPLLIIHAEQDDLVPVDEAIALYRAAGEPKEIEIMRGLYHHDVYLDPHFQTIRQRLLSWLRRHL